MKHDRVSCLLKTQGIVDHFDRVYEREAQVVHRTRAWKDEGAHATFFCYQAQNYWSKPVANTTIDLFLSRTRKGSILCII